MTTHRKARSFVHLRPRRPAPRAFSLVELIVVIGIIALLFTISLSTLRRARDVANTTQCLSNLRGIGLAISGYANDHRGCLVPGDHVGKIDGSEAAGAGSWADILVEGRYIAAPVGAYPADKLYVEFDDATARAPTILRCPSGIDANAAESYPTSQTDPRGAFYFVRGSDVTHRAVFTWYAFNGTPRLKDATLTDNDRRPLPFAILPDYVSGSPDWNLTRLSRVKANVPLIFDGVWCYAGDPARINARHNWNRATNILYGDGHCETAVTASLPNSSWFMR